MDTTNAALILYAIVLLAAWVRAELRHSKLCQDVQAVIVAHTTAAQRGDLEAAWLALRPLALRLLPGFAEALLSSAPATALAGLLVRQGVSVPQAEAAAKQGWEQQSTSAAQQAALISAQQMGQAVPIAPSLTPSPLAAPEAGTPPPTVTA